ncbi:Arginase/deacetylase [Dendrothele bispora CBS 962.96]|uniref:Arginase/deacetylase n=1 Tax=Dendrothele bispora (strain CBS 962.96) TaxID=1314807 RepID=A0A4V4HF31_DENBC|nr:Arginase/deacetylase [Dendrothele bispora CBS 962.96]
MAKLQVTLASFILTVFPRLAARLNPITHVFNPDIVLPIQPLPHIYPDLDTPAATSIFSGITTFARLSWVDCLSIANESDSSRHFDIDVGFLGVPFDTGTSYRPGARFGPSAIRAGSRRTALAGGYNVPLSANPFKSGLKIVDCGDVPLSPFDNRLALETIQDAYSILFQKENNPWFISLGGDSTINLPILRSIHKVYSSGVPLVHFGSRLDTWKPSSSREVNHLSSLYRAAREGLIKNGSSIHLAHRTALFSPEDYHQDEQLGFSRIEARDIDKIGVTGIISKIRQTIEGAGPIYLSISIDALDPAHAPATSNPETGGWTLRELRSILKGLDGVPILSASITEVAPAYDTSAEVTGIAAADIIFDILTLMTKTPITTVDSSSD